MNSTGFFNHPLQTYHFLSIANSLDILSNIFFNRTLLAKENLYKPIPVINCLCKYLHKNNNNKATIILGKELVKNSDLYGSKENETIHFDYANSMFDHIITSVVFSEFGNTFGYLSWIVSASNYLTVPFIKAKIFMNLRNTTFSNLDNTTSHLSDFSIERIVRKIIFPHFPQTQSNVRITDVDYIYAQAGLMLCRAVGKNSQNFSIREYIAVAQSVEEGVRLSQIKAEALQIFHLPALLYYFSKYKIGSKEMKTLIRKPKFLYKTMHMLFLFLNVSYLKINHLRENYVYQFYKAQSEFKHRTELAEETLKQYCPMNDYASLVNDYMNHYADYKCPNNDKTLPDLNALFSSQNERIADKYYDLEKYLILKTLGKDLVQKIEQPNVTVYRVTTVYGLYPRVFPSFYKYSIPSEDVDLFTITDSSQEVLDRKFLVYALKRNQTGMSMFTNEGNLKSFFWKIGVKRLHNAHLIHATPPLKNSLETFDNFTSNIAKPWRTKYIKMLHNQGYDATTREKVIDFSKHLIPFYSCIKDIESGTVAEIVFSCYVDTLTIIPLGSFAVKFGVQAFKAIAKNIVLSVEKGFVEFGLKNAIVSVFRETIPQLVKATGKALSELMTKEFFQEFATTLFRTVDPGLELAYTIGRAGITSLTKCFALIGRKVSILSGFIKSLRKVKQPVILQVGTFKGHNLFVKSISGKDGYGVKYFNFEERTVELRRILGYKNEMPVVLVSDANNRKRIYQIIDLVTGKLQPTRWEMNANNILQLETKLLGVRLKTIQVEGLGGRRLEGFSRPRIQKSLHAVRENSLNIWRNRIDANVVSNVLKNYVLEDYDIIDRVFHYYVIHRKLPDWIKKYKLANFNDFISLRFNAIEKRQLTKAEVVARITEYYKKNFMTNIPYAYAEIIHELYKFHPLKGLVSVEDFCAIRSYIINEVNVNLKATPEGWLTLQAFYRAVLRFVDIPSYEASACFYILHKTSEDIINIEKTGAYKVFDDLTNLNSEVSQNLRNLENIANGDKSVNVLYEVHLDHRYLAVDTEAIYPSGKVSAVLLPNTKFLIQRAGFEQIEEKLIYKITLKICENDKMILIASINRNIENLKNRINMYNNYVEDFDLSRLN